MNNQSRRFPPAASLVEYALVMVLSSVVVVGALSLTGPGVGDVFSEVVAGINAHGGGAGVEQVEETPDPCPNIQVEHWYSRCRYSVAFGVSFQTVWNVYNCESAYIEFTTADTGLENLGPVSPTRHAGWWAGWQPEARNFCDVSGGEYLTPTINVTVYHDSTLSHATTASGSISYPAP